MSCCESKAFSFVELVLASTVRRLQSHNVVKLKAVNMYQRLNEKIL